MSGTIGSNILSHSGIIAESAAGLSWSDTIVTGSTVTVEAGKGYWINTTSNACTITLPSSAEAGDQIVISDYARTWGTNKITLDSNGLNFQGQDDTYTVEYTTDGQSVNLIYSDSTKGWLPLEDDVVADEPFPALPQRAIFAYGRKADESFVSMSNLVNSSGVIAADVTGVGTNRYSTTNAPYGTDKGIFRGGDGGSFLSLSNLVSNSGVVAADVTGVGTATANGGGTGYGGDKGLMAYGDISGAVTNVSNLISNSGVVSANVTGVGTARSKPGGTGYGGDKGIIAYGYAGGYVSMSNLINTSGVVASDVSGVGTVRNHMGASTYGTGLAIFAYGATTGTSMISISNKVSNVGVIAADVGSLAGTARWGLGAAGYGADKGVFAYGKPSGSITNVKNLLSNTGTMASDVSGVGTARNKPGAVTYSLSA